jgi:hypothetical protein
MLECLIHRQPLQLRLLATVDDVYLIATTQTMIEDTEQAVSIRRVVHADCIAAARQGVRNKTRRLMTEAVVIVSPRMTRK